LKDLGDRRALEYLMREIKSSKTNRCRGTLVYARSNFNPIEYIFDLVSLVVEDTFETRGMHWIQ
jgi:hypothetical protein